MMSKNDSVIKKLRKRVNYANDCMIIDTDISVKVLSQAADTIETLQARIDELEAIPRDEADGFNTVIAHLQARVDELSIEHSPVTIRKLLIQEQDKNKRLDAALAEIEKIAPDYTGVCANIARKARVGE